MKQWLIKYQAKIAGALASLSAVVPLVALAQTAIHPPTKGSVQFRSFETAITKIFDIVIIVAGIVFVVLLLIGGVQYLTAAGNEENTKKAQKVMLDGLIGLIIVLLAWAVGVYVLKLLGLGGKDNTIPIGV